MLRTDHAYLIWLLNFRQPEGQLARWVEVHQEFNFSIQHRTGLQLTNIDVLSRCPYLSEECRYCRRKEERRQRPSATVVAVSPGVHRDRAVLFSPELLRQIPEAGSALAEVGQGGGEGILIGWLCQLVTLS